LQILLQPEQAIYGYTSAEIQTRYALCILADADNNSSATPCVFTIQHLSDHQRYSRNQELFRSGSAQALICNGWQPSAWDIITHEQ